MEPWYPNGDQILCWEFASSFDQDKKKKKKGRALISVSHLVVQAHDKALVVIVCLN